MGRAIRIYLAVAVGITASTAARSQTFDDLRKNASGLAPNALVPFRAPSGLLQSKLSKCNSAASSAEVQKRLQDAASLASNVASAIDIILELIPETHRAGEALSHATTLLSTVKGTANLVKLWDQAQEFYYAGSGHDRFEVCNPLPGLLVVRPLSDAAALPAPDAFSTGLASRLPLLSLNPSGLITPTCASPPSAAAGHLGALPPWIRGRVLVRALSGLFPDSPLEGALVTLLGPMAAASSCRTPADGTFFFDGLLPSAKYEVSVYWGGRSFTNDAMVERLSEVTFPDLIF